MRGTQVYLGEDELELLERASRDSGASRSELIRRAVRMTFGEQGKDDKLRALSASAGSWKGRRASGAEYVDAIRGGGLNDRLIRLGCSAIGLNVPDPPTHQGVERIARGITR